MTDIEKEVEEIRRRGERLLDEFEEILAADARRDCLFLHLEELKNRQDDRDTILDEIRK